MGEKSKLGQAMLNDREERRTGTAPSSILLYTLGCWFDAVQHILVAARGFFEGELVELVPFYANFRSSDEPISSQLNQFSLATNF